MLEEELWEPAGLTQRVPAADKCTEIAIAANKVIAEIKVNLRHFMLPPRCASLESNGAGSVEPLGRRKARGAAERHKYMPKAASVKGSRRTAISHTPSATNDKVARCLGSLPFVGIAAKAGAR